MSLAVQELLLVHTDRCPAARKLAHRVAVAAAVRVGDRQAAELELPHVYPDPADCRCGRGKVMRAIERGDLWTPPPAGWERIFVWDRKGKLLDVRDFPPSETRAALGPLPAELVVSVYPKDAGVTPGIVPDGAELPVPPPIVTRRFRREQPVTPLRQLYDFWEAP